MIQDVQKIKDAGQGHTLVCNLAFKRTAFTITVDKMSRLGSGGLSGMAYTCLAACLRTCERKCDTSGSYKGL